jgi:hypothetical protein
MASGEKGVGEGGSTCEARTTQPRGGSDARSPARVTAFGRCRAVGINGRNARGNPANCTIGKVREVQRTLYLETKAYTQEARLGSRHNVQGEERRKAVCGKTARTV